MSDETAPEVVAEDAVEETPAAAPEADPEVPKQETPKQETPKPTAPKQKVDKKPEPEAAPAPRVASAKPEVHLCALVYCAGPRNSGSVAAVQQKLVDKGYGEAGGDKRGWLCDGTVEALKAFQKDAGLPTTGEADADTVKALFDNAVKLAY